MKYGRTGNRIAHELVFLGCKSSAFLSIPQRLDSKIYINSDYSTQIKKNIIFKILYLESTF
jgi:hypothetical protein